MAKLMEQRKVEFIEQMLNEVHMIPINEVVGSVVPLVQRGRHYMGLCPFHPDHRLGSFVVTPDKNIWQCFAEGIGDIFSPVEIDLMGWHLVLVKPDDYVSTKEAYSLIKATPSNYALNKDVKKPVELWKESIKNDFEKSVFPNHPTIEEIRNQLYIMGASYACMSGSGSTVFALFPNEADLTELSNKHFTFQCTL